MTFETKEAALDALEEARAEYLAHARWMAKAIAMDRFSRTITIEDVRKACPMPSGIDPRVCGAVFRDAEVWEPLGYVAGTRRTSHKRPVQSYRLRHA